MKLLIDMNLSPEWIAFLGERHIEAVHWSLLGAADAADRVLMAYAREKDLVVLTSDLDFGTILAVTGAAKPSVVQIRSDDLSPSVIGDAVAVALKSLEADLLDGALVTIEPSRHRLRLLPLTSNTSS